MRLYLLAFIWAFTVVTPAKAQVDNEFKIRQDCIARFGADHVDFCKIDVADQQDEFDAMSPSVFKCVMSTLLKFNYVLRKQKGFDLHYFSTAEIRQTAETCKSD